MMLKAVSRICVGRWKSLYLCVIILFYIVFQFNAVSPLSSGDPGYNPEPSADEKVHVLVCTFSANSAEITESVLQKMATIREEASELGKTMII